MTGTERPDDHDARRETIARLGTILIITGALALLGIVAVAAIEISDASGTDAEWNWLGIAITALGSIISITQIWVGMLARRHDHRARIAALLIGGANAALFASAVIQAQDVAGLLQLAIAGACFWVFLDPSTQDLLDPAPR